MSAADAPESRSGAAGSGVSGSGVLGTVTPAGAAVLLSGATALCLGLALRWPSFLLIGSGLLALSVVAAFQVFRPSRLRVERAIQPPRVSKGQPAIAVLTFANTGHRATGVTMATQPFGAARVRTAIPRLRPGERGLRSYRLPTRQRGVFDVPPLEVVRRDPFDLLRRTRRYGSVETIWVQPRILEFRPLPTGRTRHLDGPSADTSPEGTVTFHRLRDYAVGDDLRLVHWRSSARTGRLVVRHNVDTSQPYSVVLLDVRPGRYSDATFEAAVDVTASALVAGAAGGSPVELRCSDGTVLGTRGSGDLSALMDHLTAARPSTDGDLRAPLTHLRRARGTSLVVVTGDIDADELASVAALRRRFERLVVVSLRSHDASAARTTVRASRHDPEPRPAAPPAVAGVRLMVGADADEVCAAWNLLGTATSAPGYVLAARPGAVAAAR